MSGYCDHDGTQPGMPCPFCGRLNMTPTTPHAKTAEEVARATVLDLSLTICMTDEEERLATAAIAAAIREANDAGRAAIIATVPAGVTWTYPPNRESDGKFHPKLVAIPGHILDDAGSVRRVRGELVTSEEGDVIADGARVYFPNENGNIVEWDVQGPGDHIPVGKFWTSREAALSAQGAKHE